MISNRGTISRRQNAFRVAQYGLEEQMGQREGSREELGPAPHHSPLVHSSKHSWPHLTALSSSSPGCTSSAHPSLGHHSCCHKLLFPLISPSVKLRAMGLSGLVSAALREVASPPAEPGRPGATLPNPQEQGWEKKEFNKRQSQSHLVFTLRKPIGKPSCKYSGRKQSQICW